MALRAGRVGVNPVDVNPIDGHIKTFINDEDEVMIGVLNGKSYFRKVINIKPNVTLQPSASATVFTDDFVSNISIITCDAVINTQDTGFTSVPFAVKISGNNIQFWNLRTNNQNTYTGSFAIITYIYKDNEPSTLSDEE